MHTSSVWMIIRGLLAAMLLLPCSLHGQSNATPQFEVASVKPVTGDWVYEYRITPTTFTRRGAALDWLIEFAYGLQQHFQVEGPAWIHEGPNIVGPVEGTMKPRSARFDIYARAAEPASPAQMRLMVRSLLAERWKLALHSETREVQSFVLTTGKGPLKLRKSESEDPAERRANGPGYDWKHTSMQELVQHISDFVPQAVFEETGLKGRYDFNLPFLTDSVITPGLPMDQQDYASGFASALRGLGLDLQPKKRPVEILVIDSVERVPIEN